jgi:superfamily II RNA helicase
MMMTSKFDPFYCLYKRIKMLHVINPAAPCPEYDTLDLAATYSFSLDPFQKHAICAMEKSHNVLVTAKTGSGKTLVGEYAIARALKAGKRVFYTTPIKSLSNQKFHDLKAMFPSVGILTGDIKFRPDAQVVIMTTEILKNMLYKQNTATASLGLSALVSMDNLGAVVFDECHYINDRERGKVWEECFILLDPAVQLVLLSATIDKPELFAQWLGDIKKVPIHLISTQYRIVPLIHQVLAGDTSRVIMDSRDVFNGEIYTGWLQWREGKKKEHKDHEKLVANRRAGGYEDPVVKSSGGLTSFIHQMNTTVELLERKGLLPCLFFIFSRKDCESYAKRITSTLITSSDTAAIDHIWRFHLHRYTELETLPQAHTLKSLLSKGIAFHHSGLLPLLREIVEILFGKGLIKLLFATETFAVGINMPTKTVVFTDLQKYSDESRGLRLLRTDEYIQMAGRAGRRGKDVEGHVFYLPSREPISMAEMREMMTGRKSPIDSKMDFHYEFLLKTALNQGLNWTHIMENSYWSQQRKLELKALRLELEGLIHDQLLLGLDPKSITDCQERESLEQTLKSSVNAAKKKAQQALESWKNTHMGPTWELLWKRWGSYKALSDKIHRMNETIAYLENNKGSVEEKLNFLERAGFITADRKPTFIGTLATEVNEGHSLLLAKAYEKKIGYSFTKEDLVCFLAGFLGEADKNMESVSLSSIGLTKEVEDALYYVDDTARELMALEQKCKTWSPDEYWSLNSGWIDVMRHWYLGEEAGVICSQYGLYEGNFIRTVLKLGNLVEEWVSMATYCEHTEVLQRLEGLKEEIVRGIAKPQSLYLLL